MVVTYNNEEQIGQCLESLLTALRARSAEVLVVDNGSQDATRTMVDSFGPPVRLIASGENLGFARGCNLAGERASGRWLLLLNPDTVVRPDAIEHLLEFATVRPYAGMIGGRTIRPDGTPHIDSCWAAPNLLSAFCFATGLSTAFPRSALDPESMGAWQRDTEREVDTITGLLLLLPTELWQRLGGFDEDFWMYSEDVDLGRRVRAMGYRPRICPQAVVVHEGGSSTPDGGRRTALQLQGRVTDMRKHWKPSAAAVGRLLLLTGVGLRALLGRVARPGSAGAQRWLGAWRRRSTWLAGFPSAPQRQRAGAGLDEQVAG